MTWVPLHVHSQFSILDSTASVKKLAQMAAEYQMPAMALTDQGNLHGAVDFFKACSAAGVRPIIGCELFVAPQSRLDKMRIPGQKPGYPIVLLAKDKEGYRNLCKLSSKAYMEGFYYTPRIDKELLKQHAGGLVCLSGPMQGKIAQLIGEEDEEALKEEITFYHELFGEDFYLEMTRHLMSEEQMLADGMDRESWLIQASQDFQKKQEAVGQRLLSLSKEWNIPVVATNDSRYMERSDWKGQEILMNVSSGEPVEIWERDSQGNPKNRVLNPKRKIKLTHELYFKSPAEMQEIFADCPEALSETIKVAEKCTFELDFTSKFYPVFIPPHLEGKKFTPKERESAAVEFLKKLCHEGIARRYDEAALAKVGEKYPGKDPKQVVQDRLQYELDLIISKGLGDYLLIVYDFIAWAKGQGIPVGPGRGSGAGSIVCFLTGITDIEPLRFNLFFERFINPERVSYPDIDVDICMDRRSEVIDYTVDKYGKDNVAQIITFGTMKAKMAVKDVGRVLSVPLTKVNQIAKLIPEDPNMTLDRALELDPDLRNEYESDEETKRLIDLAKTLEGSVRNTGIHAAGLIVSADPLIEHIPICNAKDEGVVVTQYAMKPVEAVGMLKIDFLGLKTLTAIQVAVNTIEESEGEKINWTNLPLENAATFQLLNQGKTLGLFQLESSGMQELAKHLHIDKFEEIIAVGALYRPGPMEMIPSFINRKHGKEPIEFDHPTMKDILEETYGIMVYQEQVMMMAQKLAGYSLGAGDVLRKAMGKKDHEEMARQKEKFCKGAVENGIEEQTAIAIFEKIEKFASYGFNKSHAAAYGYLSYVTAFLKANYPMHWMAALMTSDRDDLTKVTKIIRECQAMQISILPPDVNESGKVFVATPSGIRFAMTAVKGVGEGVVESILQERANGGAFASLYDFTKRIDTHKVGKKVIECLIEAGAFDFTTWPRAGLIASVEPMFQEAQKLQKEKARGELNFFSLIEEEDTRFTEPPTVPPLSKMDILRKEKELLGFYLTGHPLDEVSHMMQRLSCVSLQQIDQLDKGSVCRAGFVIESVTVRHASKTGRKFAILTVGDHDQRFELPIWSELYEEKGHLLAENQLLYAVLQVDRDEDGAIRLQCRWLDDLSKVDEAMCNECDLAYDKARMQAKMHAIRKNRPKKQAGSTKQKSKEEPKEKIMRTLVLKLDADKMPLSQVLEMKKIFRSFSGKSGIELQFLSGEKQVAKISIDPSWGVELTSELKNQLDSMPAVIDILAEPR
ncbi:MAG: DNA polymerase III subunit alpha [Simkaniaceae bacterium]|nr:DNA polymerase III subunit alpha [Candidatus Sacchlamyda saccharinae]